MASPGRARAVAMDFAGQLVATGRCDLPSGSLRELGSGLEDGTLFRNPWRECDGKLDPFGRMRETDPEFRGFLGRAAG